MTLLFVPHRGGWRRKREEETKKSQEMGRIYTYAFPHLDGHREQGAEETRTSLRICYLAQVGRAGEKLQAHANL